MISSKSLNLIGFPSGKAIGGDAGGFVMHEMKVGVHMLKSCSFCGKIHDHGTTCKHKPKNNRDYHSDRRIKSFRSSKAWIDARAIVLDRDYHLCRLCFDGTFGDYRKSYGAKIPLEVHHIEPLSVAFDKRIDLDNLITLCPVHHKMSDRDEVPREFLRGLAESPPGFDRK